MCKTYYLAALQLWGLCDCHKVYVAVRGYTSHSFSQKLPRMALTGQIYVEVCLWHKDVRNK